MNNSKMRSETIREKLSCLINCAIQDPLSSDFIEFLWTPRQLRKIFQGILTCIFGSGLFALGGLVVAFILGSTYVIHVAALFLVASALLFLLRDNIMRRVKDLDTAILLHNVIDFMGMIEGFVLALMIFSMAYLVRLPYVYDVMLQTVNALSPLQIEVSASTIFLFSLAAVVFLIAVTCLISVLNSRGLCYVNLLENHKNQADLSSLKFGIGYLADHIRTKGIEIPNERLCAVIRWNQLRGRDSDLKELLENIHEDLKLYTTIVKLIGELEVPKELSLSLNFPERMRKERSTLVQVTALIMAAVYYLSQVVKP